MILPTYQAKTSCVWRGKYSEREIVEYDLDRLLHLLGTRHPFTYVTESHVVFIFLQLKANIFSLKCDWLTDLCLDMQRVEREQESCKAEGDTE